MNTKPLRVLTDADLRFFDENGYVIVPNAVPPENLRAVIQAAFDFLGMDENRPDDWYRLPLTPGGMVEMYQHQALWDNRQNECVVGAFADLMGTEDLWVSFDRVNVKPPFRPDHPDYDHKGFMHWDTDITRAWNQPLRLQGVLYLTDTTENMGGFRCAPGHHNVVKAWGAETQPEPGSGARPDMREVQPMSVVGKAGDLVIWSTLLYHGNGRNLSSVPRLAQYIALFPPPADAGKREAEARDRVHRQENRLAPEGHWVIGDPRRREETEGTTARLTQTGRRILGAA